VELLRLLNSEDRLIVASLVVTIGGILVGALLAEPLSFGITSLIVIVMLVVGWRVTRSPRLAWLLLFGLVAGVLELWSDWVHVAYLGSLVYTDFFGFKLLESPLYMPIAWWLTTVQFGYLALRFAESWSRWKAVGLISLLGMSLPPWYEEFAAPAKAWYYEPTGPMLSNTPLWIVLTYGGCMFAIATMALEFYSPRSWGRAVVAGAFTAAGFMFSAMFWIWLLG
jgi:hypothetical protein